MREYRRRIDATPGARACPICGTADCGQVFCREELGSRADRARRESEGKQAKEEAAAAIDRELRSRRPGEIPASAVLVVLPASTRALIPQHPERRTLMRERLTGLVEDADADPDGPTGDPVAADAPRSSADLLTRGACTACQGHCCRLGEDHAFLRPATLRRFHQAHPEMTAAQVVDAYIARVPAESVVGSCVFQGREGCTLPRSMRSDVCNRYLCEDLERAHKSAADAPALAVCFDGATPVRTVLIEAGRVRPIDESPPKAGPG
jgi:hypothetical protein